MQNTKNYVDSLFNGYEETKNLADFKEELVSHLNDKIANFTKRGMSEDEAFKKASAELGDVSAIADEMSLKKKQEVYSEMYMRTRKYISPAKAFFYVLGGAVVFFGLLIFAIVWFSTEQKHAALASGMVFIALGAGLLSFLKHTQETATKNPIPWKRSLIYAICVTLFVFGVLCGPMAFLAVMSDVSPAEVALQGWEQSLESLGYISAIGVLLTFVLPSSAVYAFLVLTEKDCSKTWVRK